MKTTVPKAKKVGALRWLFDRLTSSFARAATATALLLGLLAAIVAVALTVLGTRTYTSSAEFAPQLSLLDGQGQNVFSLNIDGAKRFVDSQVALMKGRDVLGPVAQAHGLSYKDLAAEVSVSAGGSGATVVVAVKDADATGAQQLTSEVITSYTTVRAAQVRGLAQDRVAAITTELNDQRRLGLSQSELAQQLQRDLAELQVPLNATGESVLTMVSSPGAADPTPRGTAKVAIIALLGTAALASAVLLALRVTSDRVLGVGDVPLGEGVLALGLLRAHDPVEVSSGHAATLLASSRVHPECLLVLSASAEGIDDVAAAALTGGLTASGRPARKVAFTPDAMPMARTGSLSVVPGGWASQVPELLERLDPATVVCVVAKQGVHRSELEAAIASVRQVSPLPVGVLLLAGRSLP